MREVLDGPRVKKSMADVKKEEKRALGGELEVVASFGNRRVRLRAA